MTAKNLMHHIWPFLFLGLLFSISTIPFQSGAPYNWDAAQFVLGVQQFSVTMQQPHPPGYPLFIAGGKLLAASGISSHSALLTVSALFAAAAVLSMYLLTFSIWPHRGVALIAAVALMFNPIFWLYRETTLTYTVDAWAGITLALLTYLIMRDQYPLYVYLGALVLGVGGGFRPSMMAFFSPFVLLQWYYIKHYDVIFKSILYLTISFLFWFIPLVVFSGGFEEYYNTVMDQFLSSSRQTSVFYDTSWREFFQNVLYIKSILISSINVVWIVIFLTIVKWVYSILRKARQERNSFYFLLGLAWTIVSVIQYGFIHFGQVGYILTVLPIFYLVAVPGIRYLACIERQGIGVGIKTTYWLMLSFIIICHNLVFLLLKPTNSFQYYTHIEVLDNIIESLYRQMRPMLQFNKAHLHLKDQQVFALKAIVEEFNAEEVVVLAPWGAEASGVGGIFNDDVLRKLSTLSPAYLAIIAHTRTEFQLIQRNFTTVSKRDKRILLPESIKFAVFSLDGIPTEQWPYPILFEPRYSNIYDRPFFVGVVNQPFAFFGYTVYRKDIRKLETFVARLYEAVLGRTPAASEVATWVDSLEVITVSAMIHAFFDGPEYQQRRLTHRQHVAILYQAILGRDPDAIEIERGARDLLERFNAVLLNFLRTEEFQSLVPNCKDQREVTMMMTRMHQHALNRTPTAFEVSEWVDDIRTKCNVKGALAAFFNSSEYLSVPRTLAEHVSVLYRSFLARESDAAGLEAWVNELVQQFQAIEDTFISSAEFQERFRMLFQ